MAGTALVDFTVCHPTTLQRFVYVTGDPVDPFHEWWMREQGCPISPEDDTPGAAEHPEDEQPEDEQAEDEQAAPETPQQVLGATVAAADSADDPSAAFDPSQHTVADVLAYAKANPAQAQQVLAAERVGRARTTILSELA
ncbi:hypothetical protein [Kineosporia sp. R_H_3]|uniref:hypothetical protein n=1 Tax=Kineosporia sp. R_H_3 TaxID=1961848 RepID=UPI000B4BDDB0|nr:hypothetical protein [Kineosporia sp. R_H_3]